MASPKPTATAAVSVSTGTQTSVSAQKPVVGQVPTPSAQMTSLSSMFSQAQTQRQQMTTNVSHAPTPSQQTAGGQAQVQQPVVIQRVDPKRLWDAWQRYMLKIKQSNGQLYSSMGVGPQLENDGITVDVRIASEFERGNIESNAELVSYLRTATENNNLVIKAVIDPSIAKGREVIYTASQKLEKMRSSNPYLDVFMKELGLIAE